MTARRVARLVLDVGIVGAVLGLSKYHAAIVAVPAYDFTESSRFGWALAYVLTLAVAAYGVGLPDLPRTLRSALLSSVVAAAMAALAISVVQLVVGDALLPRFVVLGGAGLLVPWYVLCTAIALGGRHRAEERDRVVVVADPAEVALLERDLDGFAERPAHVVAAMAPAAAGGVGPAAGRPLVDLVHGAGASVLVLDRRAQLDERTVAQAAWLHERGVRVRTVSLFYEQWLGKLPLAELERVSLLFDIKELHSGRYLRLKRMLDLVLGGLGLVAFVAAIPFVAVGNLFGNRGPLFYSQPRVGKNGKEFAILKFRTMVPGPGGESPNEWTREDDPRITRFGRVLRATHVDELPQMVNIVRGDLSLVGPRPEQPRYVAELAEKLPFYEVRHLVRPGLTGWAQVKYGYAGDETDAMEKLQYEFFYLRHQSIGLDVRILGRTVRSVFGREGR